MTPFCCIARRVFAVPVLLACVSLSLSAQTTDARMTGIVTDQSKAIIRGAQVVAINNETGIHYPTTTNASGIYVIAALPVGQYRIEVENQGFKSIVMPGVILHVQDIAEINFEMSVGSTAESITINGSGLQINTTDASVGTVVDRQFVENLPLNGRSFQDLILLTPGVATESPQSNSSNAVGSGGDFVVNGQRAESNYYTVDGVSANTLSGTGTGTPGPGTSGTIASATALGTTQSLISVDSLQEFQVQSSTYSAEFGRAPGGQFLMVSRSGTNDFHGTAFDYLRNDVFDANNWFNDFLHAAKSPLRQNDFGGTLGGPIQIPHIYNGRHRTFFFVSYEGLRLQQPTAASVQYVPSASARSTAAPALQAIMNAFPLPTPGGVDFGDGLAQFTKAYSLPSNINATSIRVDEHVTPRLNIFFRFTDTPAAKGVRALSSAGGTTTTSQTYTLGATSQFSTSIANEARLGYSTSSIGQTSSLDSFGGAQPTDLSQAIGVAGFTRPEPFVDIFTSSGFSSLSTETLHNSNRNWNITDSLSRLVRTHSLKVGADYRWIQSPLNPPSVVAEAIYESLHSIQTNAADLGEVLAYSPGTPTYNNLSFYVQDQWRVNPRLSMSSGVRWDINPAPTEAAGQGPYTLQGSINDPQSLTLAPRGTSLWKTTWYNFAPRLGVAFIANPEPSHETVLRGGAGIFFDTGNEYASGGYNGIGYQAVAIYSAAPMPFTTSQLSIAPSATPPYTGSVVYAFDPNLKLPYTVEWNVSIEQELGDKQAITLAYVGASGQRLLESEQLSIHAINPNFGTISYTKNGLSSNFQSLQAKFQRALSRGLQAIGSYTWAHSIDFGSRNSAFPYLRGDSDFDVREQFIGGLSWDIQQPRRNGVVDRLVQDWGADAHFEARTAFPVNLQGSAITDQATGIQYYGGVNFNANVPVYLYGPGYPGGHRLNPKAFTAVTTPGQNGDVPRNFFRGFDCVQLNAAIRKTFSVDESLKLQFRAEAFNLLNHPIFGYVNPTLTNSTFGEATQTLNQSLGTVSPLYQQGGPRSLQFALKLMF